LGPGLGSDGTAGQGRSSETGAFQLVAIPIARCPRGGSSNDLIRCSDLLDYAGWRYSSGSSCTGPGLDQLLMHLRRRVRGWGNAAGHSGWYDQSAKNRIGAPARGGPLPWHVPGERRSPRVRRRRGPTRPGTRRWRDRRPSRAVIGACRRELLTHGNNSGRSGRDVEEPILRHLDQPGHEHRRHVEVGGNRAHRTGRGPTASGTTITSGKGVAVDLRRHTSAARNRNEFAHPGRHVRRTWSVAHRAAPGRRYPVRDPESRIRETGSIGKRSGGRCSPRPGGATGDLLGA
jgi:hypothetical protein